MRIRFTYPEGKEKALTFSYDDGIVDDRRLVDIFNKYNCKATFHLNSGLLGDGRHVSPDEVKTLYAGHEVSCHSVTHPTMAVTDRESIVTEILEDRRNLERLVGYPVTGLSYPNGSYNSEVIAVLKALGIVYSRTVKSTGSFTLPDDFMEWHPTCHHPMNILEKADAFEEYYRPLGLFYVWGHSYEFDRNDNWELIEEFCAKISGNDNVWYATNIEIYEYICALKQIQFSVDRRLVRNLSHLPVWFKKDGDLIKLEPRRLLNLN